ncbi:PAS domain-containing protein [Halobellus sp. GM3]|uniref:PAS domain-containing protein n=1 Tax=Halobellus sp. GM3 TaxID=3458410 RepID=UPI00403D8F63
MPSADVLESALDALSGGVVIADADGRISYADRAFCESMGLEDRQLLDSDLFEALVPAGERESARRAFRAPFEGDETERVRTPVVTAGGEHRAVDWIRRLNDGDDSFAIGRLRSLPGGECEGSEGGATRGVEGPTEPYRTLVEHFPNGIVTLFDEQFRYRIVGGQIFDELSIEPADLEGSRLEEVFPEENVAELRPLYAAAFEGETNTTSLSLEGRTFEIQVLPVRDDAGDVVAGMTVSHDVTERRARERQLRDARERYHTLVENAPVPIIVADDAGEIRELNAETESLLGRTRERLVGERITALHPAGDAEQYEEIFAEHVETGGAKRYRADGEQICVVDGDGARTPVEINVTTVDLADERLVYGVFRDITEQVRYESALESLHENASELVRAETEPEIAQRIVETAVETLGHELITVYRFDAETGGLFPMAYADAVSAVIGDPPRLTLDGSIAGEVYLGGESKRLRDVRTHERVYDPETPVRSEIIVPIEGFGVIRCGDTGVDTLDATDQRLLELLSKNAEAVFERTQREQELKRKRRALKEQTRTLQRVEQLNAEIRELVRLAVTADSRAELEAGACELFSDTGSFAFAWIGELTAERDAVVPRTWAGDDQGYLDAVTLSIEDGVVEPAVQAARSDSTAVVQNTAREIRERPWQRDALRRGFRSACAVPLRYQDVIYGVLSVFATDRDAFSERVVAVLEECGELLGCVMNMLEWRNALLSPQGTDLEFRLRSKSCPLLRVAQEHACTLSFEGLHERESGDTTVFVRLLDGPAAQVVETAERATGIASIRTLTESNGGVLFQITFSEPFVATELVNYGLQLRRILGETDGRARIRVTAPATMPTHRAVEIVSTLYPDSTLVSTDERDDPGSVSDHSPAYLLGRLTDRQREVLELAFHAGYFESPKGLSGAEIAEKLGISSSAFHNHLRAAQRTVLGSIIERDASPTRR